MFGLFTTKLLFTSNVRTAIFNFKMSHPETLAARFEVGRFTAGVGNEGRKWGKGEREGVEVERKGIPVP